MDGAWIRGSSSGSIDHIIRIDGVRAIDPLFPECTGSRCTTAPA